MPIRYLKYKREDKKRGVFVENLSEWAVRSPSEIYRLIKKGSLLKKKWKKQNLTYVIGVGQIEREPEKQRA